MPDLPDFESVAERQIREAMERGEFDNLPGEGQPLDDAGVPYDPAWWAKRWIARNRDLADEAVSPDAESDVAD